MDPGRGAQSRRRARARARICAAIRVAGRTLAVCGILADKDAAGVAAELRGCIDAWWCASHRGRRAAAAARRCADAWRARLAAAGRTSPPSVEAGCAAALAARAARDRIVVFGSFHTVGPALDWLEARGLLPPAAVPEYTATPRATELKAKASWIVASKNAWSAPRSGGADRADRAGTVVGSRSRAAAARGQLPAPPAQRARADAQRHRGSWPPARPHRRSEPDAADIAPPRRRAAPAALRVPSAAAQRQCSRARRERAPAPTPVPAGAPPALEAQRRSNAHIVVRAAAVESPQTSSSRGMLGPCSSAALPAARTPRSWCTS